MSDHEDGNEVIKIDGVKVGAIEVPANKYEKGEPIVVEFTLIIGPSPQDDPPD